MTTLDRAPTHRPTTTPTRPAVRYTAAGLALAVAAIHFLQTPEYYGLQPYIGVLFVVGAVVLVAAAVVVAARDHQLAWLAGGAVTAGMFLGFLLSRTTGLPAFYEGEWDVSGLVSLVLEAGYLALLLRRLR